MELHVYQEDFFFGSSTLPCSAYSWLDSWSSPGRQEVWIGSKALGWNWNIFFSFSLNTGASHIYDKGNRTLRIIVTKMSRSLSSLSSTHQRQQKKFSQHKPSWPSVEGMVQRQAGQGQKVWWFHSREERNGMEKGNKATQTWMPQGIWWD